MLAKAHNVERLVEHGKVASYADAARQLGVTRARMSQLMNLLNLPPRVQERLLLGDLHLSERGMRALAGRAEWEGPRIVSPDPIPCRNSLDYNE